MRIVKQKTPEQELRDLRANIVTERRHWESINENGCNDPFWTDGCNMNLIRNHIIYHRRKIEEICMEHGFPLPEEYFLKIPPQVDDNYMASLKHKRRVERLQSQGNKLTRRKVKFVDDGQMEFV